MKNFLIGFVLAVVTWLLIPLLTIINFFYVRSSDYFRSTALDTDKWANREFRTLWNDTLITQDGYTFGNSVESISGVLGKNIKRQTLTKKGKLLVRILTEQHCINAIKK